MKTIPPVCPEPETGPKYWRSLDQIADTPEFRQFVEREFPAGASEMTDPVTRRSFVKLMSASFMLAGVGLAGSGCRRPVENILPFSKMPEGYVHGLAKYYATAMPVRNGAIPLLAKSTDGRPTKLEGNAEHPEKNGGTDRFTQAAILNLYDPDRAIRITHNSSNATAAAANDALSELSKAYLANGGEGLSFLAEQSSSPSRAALVKELMAKMPKAGWHEFEPVDFDIHRDAATRTFGSSVTPYFNIEKAKIVVSLDSDFLGNEENLHLNIRKFASGRKTKTNKDGMNRLYSVEGLMTITGANADHRLRIATGLVPVVAAKMAVAIAGLSSQALDSKVEALASSNTVTGADKWIGECVKDLIAAGPGKTLILAGQRQPLAVHLLANAMNIVLGNVDSTISLLPVETNKSKGLEELVANMNSGSVQTLVVLGANPAYSAPVDLAWDKAVEKVKEVVHLAYYEDESFATKGWNLPQTHFLETWGDARTSDGTVVAIQPLIEPLFGGISELEVLARIIGASSFTAHEIVRATFRGMAGDSEDKWKEFLYEGYLKDTATKAASFSGISHFAGAMSALASVEIPQPKAPSKDALEVVFHRDYSVDDGRFNNNGWMQELPDPITKLTWENVILVSVKTARELGVYTGNEENNRLTANIVKVNVDGREIEGPVWAQLGQADNTIGLALGYGRTKTGRIGAGSGYNAYKVRTSKALHVTSGAKLTASGKNQLVSVTQDHGVMEGRPIIREATLSEYQKHPNFASGFNMERPPVYDSLYKNPLDDAKNGTNGVAKAHHQWGMSIDLSACVGCSSCMIACQSENNIPIVGKEQVSNNREMHWIRIDRYFTTGQKSPYEGDTIVNLDEDKVQIVNQPMLCQHCEAAPCESVCPVNATVHDQEGLNVMVYNRCVGTRYCSNNCPYKVRRFNFFDYNRRTLEQLKEPYTTPITHSTDGEWDLLRWWKDPDRGTKPSDEWELLKFVKNPEVTVRMRGVMEKCSYCVQRIESAKIRQKVKAGASDDVFVPDGTIKTACQQACPAEAIIFGNIADPESEVSKAKAIDRTYKVLDFLNTKPRTTYLARVRNPNPLMPDAYTTPHSTEEYMKKNDLDPIKAADELAEEGAGKSAEHGAEKGAY